LSIVLKSGVELSWNLQNSRARAKVHIRKTSVKVARLDIAARAAGSMNWFATFQTFQWEGYEISTR
jgi:hypothetical protein